MYSKKITFSVFLLCAFAATALAQNQTKELGSADELKDVTKVYVDTGTLFEERENITLEIRKKLREVKRELEFVSKPEDSDIHLRFSYETQARPTPPESPPVGTIRVPVGEVVKVFGKDRVRVLMSYRKERRVRIGFGIGKDKPEIEFAREFVKAYLNAKSKKPGQRAPQLSS